MQRKNRSKSGQMARNLPTTTLLPSSAHDWKNNPLVVASAASAGTILLCIAIVTQIVIPTQTAKLESEALKAQDEARQHRESSASFRDSSKKANDELTALKIENENLLKDLKAARVDNLLGQSSPYPHGLSSARVGMPIDAVYANYPKEQIVIDEKSPTTVKVSLKGFPFATVWYSYGKSDPKKIIESISFNLGYDHGYPESFCNPPIYQNSYS